MPVPRSPLARKARGAKRGMSRGSNASRGSVHRATAGGGMLGLGAFPRANGGLVVLCAIVLTMGALFYVWQRYQFTRLGFELGQLRARKATLEARLDPLEVEAIYLARPERIGALATGELGMRPPRAAQVIDVNGYELIAPAAD